LVENKTEEKEMTAEEERAYQARVAAAMEAMQEEEEEGEEARAARLAEERRKRREAIMAKHAAAKRTSVRVDADENATDANAALPGGAATGPASETPPAPKEPVSAKPRPKPVSDMFAADDDEDEAEEREIARVSRLAAKASAKGSAADMSRGLADNWDDADGYYRARVGEVLDDRYVVSDAHGRGVFSTVVKARDTLAVDTSASVSASGAFGDVALKVIRANDTMYKAAQLEITILKKLMATDPDDKRHVVRFLRSFEFRDHVFMVFESMHANLREVLKKYGRDVGINIRGVRSFATQLLVALRHLRDCGVVHADIKPDNILVNESNSRVKICDFGSALFDGNNEITPYLQSRFYRAPEVILGLKYSFPLDVWSVGCVLYELYTGAMAFPGSSNNHMMRLFIEMKGPLPRKLLRKAAFREHHYDADGNFSAAERDPVTKREIRRTIRDARPLRDLAARVNAHARNDDSLTGEERKLVAQLVDLLDKMFAYDPEKRIAPAAALAHPFLTAS
jgi:serine/threonine-protein kinase PRP4